MKRFIIIIFSMLLCVLTITFIFKDKDKNTIKLGEVTHSIFYAPLYVAIENGYFKDEGINLELVLVSGADKVSAAVLSGDIEIGFAGPESTIYIYNQNEKDYLISFAGLTKRDGQFIVSREPITNFKISDLYNKEILVGRTGGMPALNFINGVKRENGNINNINVNTSIDFASLTGTFVSGVGDFVNLFEHSVIQIS